MKTKKFRYRWLIPYKKMKHVLVFLFIIAIFAIAFIVFPSLSSPTGFAVAEDKDNKSKELPSFRLYTKAECENLSGFVVCHDELFASCGTFEYKLPKNEINGHSIFDDNWEDPRNK